MVNMVNRIEKSVKTSNSCYMDIYFTHVKTTVKCCLLPAVINRLPTGNMYVYIMPVHNKYVHYAKKVKDIRYP